MIKFQLDNGDIEIWIDRDNSILTDILYISEAQGKSSQPCSVRHVQNAYVSVT